jgi:hypothetical protein
MSLSPDTIARRAQVSRTDETFAFPLILLCVALVLILISAVFSRVTLGTTGTESFLIGP